MELISASAKDMRAIKRIYNEAFPKNERAPFGTIARRAKKGRAAMLAAKEDGEVTGFAYVVERGGIAYLFYFAVRKDRRGAGIGTEILKRIKDTCGSRLFLAREQLDESADNYGMRVRRRAFYMRNGFTDIPRTIREATVVFDVMSADGEDIAPDEYLDLMLYWGGKKVLKLVEMK